MLSLARMPSTSATRAERELYVLPETVMPGFCSPATMSDSKPILFNSP